MLPRGASSEACFLRILSPGIYAILTGALTLGLNASWEDSYGRKDRLGRQIGQEVLLQPGNPNHVADRRLQAGEDHVRALTRRKLLRPNHQAQPGAVNEADVREVNDQLSLRQSRGRENSQLEGVQNRVGFGVVFELNWLAIGSAVSVTIPITLGVAIALGVAVGAVGFPAIA